MAVLHAFEEGNVVVTTIRAAREDEASLLADIGLAAWESAIAGVDAGSAENVSMQEVAHFAFLAFARSRWHRIHVAETDGLVIGWAACERPDGVITDFWIHPDFQRKGVGARLMDKLEIDILSEGTEVAETATHVDNAAALAFFAKRGFHVAWLSTRYAARLDRDVEQIGLRKSLICADETEDGVYGASGAGV
ncbi:GNAT family N-acetyltransferase [Rhizobium sp. Leaf341]|uniref:GNAT family N-acetyltransferase n=1 Tax=Rhizobium sp. Leaf341 TaxID=1736344 RepID=UPI000715627E|nr:GNAT family N-acetyltransferase [Rhizobium sp. Leaf341]KQR73478.1 hypothetical protein ASG03_01380 [Rhizobium sp. Leaf341]